MITIDTKRFSPNAFLGIITTINQSKEIHIIFQLPMVKILLLNLGKVSFPMRVLYN